MNRLAEVEAFIAVVEAGSQLAASRKLNMAVSAINRRIKDLESRLGVALTRRTPQGTALTLEGRSYFERCLRVVSDLDEADAQATGDMHKASGLIRMTVPSAFGLRHLAPILNRFSAEHPDIRFDIHVSDGHVDLIEDEYDLAIRIGGIERPQLDAETVHKIGYVLCASPAFWDKHGYPSSPADLVGLPALIHGTGAVPTHWQFRSKAGKVSKVSVTPRFVSNDGGFLIEAAKAGLGIAIEPTFVCDTALNSGELVAALNDYETFDRVAQIMWPIDRPISYRVRRFLDALKNEI